MNFEHTQFQREAAGMAFIQTRVRFITKRLHGPYADNRVEAVGLWAVGAFGIGLNVGDLYDEDGVHQHKVFAIETRHRSGRFCKTKLGAVLAFMFKAKHAI